MNTLAYKIGCLIAENTMEKTALPRYEKEILEGNISRERLGGTTPKETRDLLYSPAARSEQAVDRTRAINKGMYSATMNNGGPRGMVVTNKPIPGVYAGAMTGYIPEVHVPENSGQFLRTVTEPLGGYRGIAASLSGVVPPQYRDLLNKALVKAKPVDDTLRQAVLQHEIGEASTFNSRVMRPFSSHAGAEPILRENLALLGDPEATQTFQKIRNENPEDALVQKLVRRAGGTPDSPIPLDSRRQRAVNRLIDQNANELSTSTRLKALFFQAQGAKVPYVPEHVSRSMRRINSPGNPWNKFKPILQYLTRK